MLFVCVCVPPPLLSSFLLLLCLSPNIATIAISIRLNHHNSHALLYGLILLYSILCCPQPSWFCLPAQSSGLPACKVTLVLTRQTKKKPVECVRHRGEISSGGQRENRGKRDKERIEQERARCVSPFLSLYHSLIVPFVQFLSVCA